MTSRRPAARIAALMLTALAATLPGLTHPPSPPPVQSAGTWASVTAGWRYLSIGPELPAWHAEVHVRQQQAELHRLHVDARIAARVAARKAAARAAARAAAADQAKTRVTPTPAPVILPAASTAPPVPMQTSGILTPAQVGAYWLQAGGPPAAELQAESVAWCESGDNPQAFNPSGATGLMQILGQVVPGNLFDPLVNMENAVSKYEAAGGTWAAWVCQPA